MYQSDNDNSHIVDAATPYMSVLTLVVTIFFAICIGLGVISILGTASMTFCKMYSCRYTVYLICVMLGVLAIFCFLVAVVFSIVTPAVYFSCDYLKVTVSSP